MKKQFLSLAMVTALPFPLIAQETNAVLDEVVVSAYAVPSTLNNIGSAVTKLNESDWQNRDATTLAEVLQTVPGVSLGATGGRGAQTSVFLRGADSDQTLMIMDGVKMNPASGAGVDFGALPLNQLETIEILRGEQSALWGADAVGGVIYITTKSGKNADKPFNADVQLGGGSNSNMDASATLYGRQGGLYYALAAANNRSDGISSQSKRRFTYQTQDGNTVNTGGAVETDKYQRGSGSLRLGYEFDQAGVELLASHITQTTHFDATDLSSETRATPHTRMNENVLRLSGYVGDDSELFKHNVIVENVSQNSETFSEFPSKDNGNKRRVNYQVDVNFDRDGATTQALSALLEYQKNTLNTNNFSADKTIKQNSVALEYRLFNNEDHAFSVSARYDDNSEFDNAFTYRLAGGYRISEHFRLHSSFGTAIKNPTMYDYYGYFGAYTANPDLKPEKSRGGDVGMLLQSRDGMHNLDVTYFDREVDELITTNADFTQSINIADTSTMRGLELSLNSEISDDWQVYANYTYTKTEDATGKQLARRPTHQASAGLNYQITPQWAANVNVLYVGERLNNYFDSKTYQSSAVDMPDYTLVNLGANYQISDNISVYAHVNNVFDQAYENVIGYGQQARTFYLGVKANW